MKKNLMIVVAFALIFTHIIPPYNISFANDEVNDCENMDFTVQTIRENDKKISGTAQPSQKLKIDFKTKNKTEVINIAVNGKFELKVEEGSLALDDVITISNDYFKVETKAVSEESATSKIQSNQYVECPIVEEKNIEEVLEESPNTKDHQEEKLPEEAVRSAELSNQESIEEKDATTPTLDTPKINSTSADGYTISGSDEESGDTVTLSNEVANELGSTIIEDDGTYTFDLPADTVEQGGTLSLLSEDDAGNLSNEVTVTVPIEDTKPLELEAVAIDGNSTDDYEITGSSEPNTTLSVTNTDDDEVGTGTTDDEGDFIVDVTSDDVSPDEILSVVATDGQGNESDFSTVTVPVDQDTIEPVLSSADIEGNSTDGYRGVGKGEEPGDTVNFINETGAVVGTGPIGENGAYSFTLAGDFNPDEVLKVQAVDEAGNESNIVQVTVPSDIIKIESLPDIIFNSTSITDEKTLILRQSENNSIKITNASSKGNWTLSANANSLNDDKGNIIPNALIYKKKNDEEVSLENGYVPVATNEDAKSEGTTDTITWSENEGILLKLNPIQAKADTEYSTTINWTLTEGP